MKIFKNFSSPNKNYNAYMYNGLYETILNSGDNLSSYN